MGQQTFFEQQIRESQLVLEEAQRNLIAFTRKKRVVSAELGHVTLLCTSRVMRKRPSWTWNLPLPKQANASDPYKQGYAICRSVESWQLQTPTIRNCRKS